MSAWTDTTDTKFEYTDVPDDWGATHDGRGDPRNTRPAIYLGDGNQGAVIQGDSLATLAAWLRSKADKLDPHSEETPVFTRAQLRVVLAHFESMQSYHYEESGGDEPCDGYEEQEQYGISLGYGDAVTTIRDLITDGKLPSLAVDAEGEASDG